MKCVIIGASKGEVVTNSPSSSIVIIILLFVCYTCQPSKVLKRDSSQWFGNGFSILLISWFTLQFYNLTKSFVSQKVDININVFILKVDCIVDSRFYSTMTLTVNYQCIFEVWYYTRKKSPKPGGVFTSCP